MVPQIVWNLVQEGQTHLGVFDIGIRIGCFGERDCQSAALQWGLVGLDVSVALR